ncbi:MAG: hypothetical protein PHQ05_01560 [Sterolibacterium sp.]|nr:hypothetical protein [Sterolibacterium sp.]
MLSRSRRASPVSTGKRRSAFDAMTVSDLGWSRYSLIFCELRLFGHNGGSRSIEEQF